MVYSKTCHHDGATVSAIYSLKIWTILYKYIVLATLCGQKQDQRR